MRRLHPVSVPVVLHRSPSIIQSQLLECLKAILYCDYPEQWPSLLPAIAQHLASPVQDQLASA